MLKAKSINGNQWFLLFILLHLIAFTLTPIFMRFNLPMDSMEGATWGKQFEWGYDKNPFMNAWITGIACRLGRDNAIYLFSQLSVIICFCAIYQLAKKIVPPLYALVSVLALEGLQYYNLHAIDLSDNTLELSMWSLTILFFYNALTKKRFYDWLLTGFFAGLAMMTKYYSALLLLSLGLIILFEFKKKDYKNPFVYAGLIIFLIIISPHCMWLIHSHFITFYYTLSRTKAPPTLWNHFYYPALFIFQQAEVIFPMFLLLLSLLIGKKPCQMSPKINLNTFNNRFVLLAGYGPFCLTILISLSTGIQLRAAWGMPLLSLFGIGSLLLLQPHITAKKFYRFFLLMMVFLILNVIGYSFALYQSKETSSAIFPGQEIANTFTQMWHHRYHTSLNYVAGTRWIAGNIAYYSKDKPDVFIEWNQHKSPWINEKTLQKKGALFVWDNASKEKISIEAIYKRYPMMTPIQTFYFNWHRNTKLSPITLQVAFLSPTQ